MWSFTARLTLMMTEKLDLKSPYSDLNFLETDIYPLQWKPSAADQPPDISGLPPIDYALYLFNTVKFHLGQNYRLFDEGIFVGNLQDFYHGNASQKATESRLWFVQFLLVLSFGTAFLSGSRNKGPPGAKFFVRAMSLIPDHASLWKDSLLAIEVMALAGLYMYSIDHRESAHVYVSIFHITLPMLMLILLSYSGWPSNTNRTIGRVTHSTSRRGTWATNREPVP